MRYDAELDAHGGYDHDDENLLTEEELEMWAWETQAEIDAEWDARYAQEAAGIVVIARTRHIDLSQPPY